MRTNDSKVSLSWDARQTGWVVCIIVSCFYCYEYFLRILPSPITAELMRHFSIGSGALGYMIAFYYHAYAVLQLPIGFLMDRYSPRLLLTFACGLCVFGSYLFAVSNNFWIGSLGRFWIGFGSAFGFIGVLKAASIWMPPSHFAIVSGLTTTLGMLGAGFGNVLLARLVEKFGWQWVNSLVTGLGLLLCIGLFVLIPKNYKNNQLPMNSFKTVLQQLRVVFRKRDIWLCGMMGSFLYASLSVFAEIWGTTCLEKLYQLNAVQSAMMSSMVFLGWAIGAPFNGWLSNRLRSRLKPLRWGSLFGAVSIVIVLYVPNISLSLGFILLFIYGYCCSTEIIIFAVVRELCGHHILATIIAFVNMLVMISGQIFQPLVGKILDLVWDGTMLNGMRQLQAVDFQWALIALPMLLILAWGLSFYIKETYQPDRRYRQSMPSGYPERDC